ncbi:MAG: hypothetical protein ACK46J_01035, partial [Burkholderiales bacterium]
MNISDMGAAPEIYAVQNTKLTGVALNGVTFDPTGPYWENGTGDYWKNPPNPWTFEVMSAKV